MKIRPVLALCMLLTLAASGGMAWILMRQGPGSIAALASDGAAAPALPAPPAPRVVPPTAVDDRVRETRRPDPSQESAREADGPSALRQAARQAAREAAAKHRPARISGTVRTLAGIGLEDILVSAAPNERLRAKKVWARTDADGAFQFLVPDEPNLLYLVEVAGGSEDPTLRHLIRALRREGDLSREDVAPGTVDLEFDVPAPGTVALIVVDAVTGLRVPWCELDWALPTAESFRPYGRGLRFLAHDETGQIHAGLPAGPLRLRIRAGGYAEGTLDVEVIPHAQSQPYVIELEPHPLARVRFELDESSPPGRAMTRVNPTVVVDRDGRFSGTVYLLTPEEYSEHEGDLDDYFVSHGGFLEARGRVLEAEPNDWFETHPEPGTYRFVAFPDAAEFTPPEVVVPAQGVEALVAVKLRPTVWWEPIR